MTALFEEKFDVHDPVEVHWSSSTILAIFFAASLVSAVFFGLGYSFGGAGTSKHSLTFNSSPASSSAAESAVQQAKPIPLTASNQPSPITNLADNRNAHPTVAPPSTPPAALRPIAMTPVAHATPPVAEKKSMPPPIARHDEAPPVAKTSGHIMVQVGAIGDRKDAERLVAELRQKGFHAGIYTAKNDKFLHVQIGPFKDAAQAESKRHQVMASGFHAILKST
ncbi:MAG TPA: SPOR domain-containing protein [Acidobacteriaceae bacterium]|nr:SPOR domain-containing protein [Acidobacteriaceae bacterium]